MVRPELAAVVAGRDLPYAARRAVRAHRLDAAPHGQRDIRRRNAADPACLGDTHRLNARELLAGFDPQLRNTREIEIRGNALFRQSLLAIDLLVRGIGQP